MRRLLLPVFALRLLLSLTPFLFHALLVALAPIQSFVLTVAFFLYFLALLSTALSPPPQLPVSQRTLKPSLEIESEIAKWQSLYQQQPTHRDVLINLSLLYSAQGDDEKAYTFWNKAREIDPNNEVITRLSN